MSAPQKNGNTGIAIVGMAGRFPKARNIDEFWRNLCDGIEGISFFTDEELAATGVEFPKNNPGYVKARGILEDADLFDAAFFGMTPREAEVMDPQHRIFLECAWEALEHAGCDPARFDGAIGVFAGMSMNTYLAHNLLTHPELVAQLNEHQLMLGNDKDFLPTRVSYKLNLRGPSVNIQTACSTSLVAVCVACQNLLNYDCDLALAGAVSITFPQKRGYLFQEGGIASPDGHCRAFDAKAAGTVAGEGAAIVVLKRVEDALADGDTIYAVIKGFATNNDGANKIGYTAPSVEGQAEVIATAQAMAGVAPETIGYIEAHGTGTPLGDPIEIEGLTRAFRAGTDKTNFCAVGSVKSNVGHLDTAAGVTGLIKTALALHHKRIPPSLHFQSPNPKIDFANSPFFVSAKLAEWKNGTTPRRAGVSSFGIGGTNAHVVLEEAVESREVLDCASPPALSDSSSRQQSGRGLLQSKTLARQTQLLLLSAKTETALDVATKNLGAHLKQHPGINLADVAYTLQVGRREFPHRRALVCRDAADAVNILESRDARRVFSRATETENPPLAFMFPGQGAQQVNMGRELYEQESAFREEVDRCCEMLRPHLGVDLRETLYPEPENVEEAQKQLTQTATTQPALFVVEYALAKLWMNWGLRPQAMIGHSIGEYVAACLAGVFSLEDSLTLVAARGRLMQQLPPGTMLAVRLPAGEVQPLLGEKISLAAVNAPSLCVVSGSAEAIESLQRKLAERGVACTSLQTSHAFHSAMMEPILKPFAELVGKLKLSAPKIPFISNVTGTWISAEQATDPNYWTGHLRQTVRFADGVAELFKEPARVLLEAGPGQTLSNLAKQHPARGAGNHVISSLRRAKDTAPDRETLLNALGQLWLSGVAIDWRNFWKPERRCRVSLPTYPFERKRHFIEPAKSSHARTVVSNSGPPEFVPPQGEIVPIRRVSASAAMTPKEKIVEALRTLLRDLSGVNSTALADTTTFAEMGFESLFLTQFSVAIEKKFGVRVAFRQLLEELSTLDALATHLEHSGDGSVESAAAKPANGENCLSLAPTIPLTEAQRELWLASQISDAASCGYNECRRLHLRGELKENTLIAAIQRLVERHEALKTTFSSSGEFQQIKPALKLEVPLLDWSALPADARASRLDALQRDEARLPFDLVAGPVLRAWLIRLAEEHHVLVLTVHHIVCDGHSLGILLGELAEIYSAECGGARCELATPLQWSEYARRQSLENPAREADEAFWLKQFAQGAPVLELPTDRSRSPSWTFDGARESRLLPATLGAELKRISARRGGTLFTTLLTAYGALLHRLSGQDEVVVGIPVADRAMDGGESLVGHCVNFLPLRLKFDAGETFEANLARAQKIFFEAHEHQGFTFGSLLQKLNLPRETGRMPLVSVTFNTQRLGEGLKFAGLETELDTNPFASTHFDLGFDVTDLGGALQLNCRYNTSLFNAETIRRWLGHYQTMLEGVVADPARRVGELPLLTEAERKQILVGWNPTAANPAKLSSGKCLHQLFEKQVNRTPDAAAVTFENQSLTYRELNQRADRLAQRLSVLGVGPEMIVGLCLERSVEMVVGILAILKAGGAYVPLDPAYPKERLEFMLRDSQAPVLVTQQSLRDRFQFEIPNLKWLCVDEEHPESSTRAKDENENDHVSHSTQHAPRPSTLNPQPSTSLAYVLYTSGSTGVPKGVAVEHRNAVSFIRWAQTVFTREELAGVLFSTSLCFDLSVFELFVPLCSGGRVILARNALELPGLPAKDDVTLINTVPSAARELLQLNAIPASVRVVNLAGEPLPPALADRLYAIGTVEKVHDLYGPTETTTYATCALRQANGAATIGRPIANTRIYILDRNLQPVPIGVPGEIYIGGAGVARGYLNRPELTAERFIASPFSSEPGARLYKTGDLARWLAEGDIEYLGRIDNQVKIRGHRIELGEIESALSRHPGVRECVVLAREDLPGDKRLAAYVVSAGKSLNGELREALKKQLPDYMVPSSFLFLDKLPLTANGKIDRRALPTPEPVRPDAKTDFAAPRTPTEAALADIWQEVLHLDRVGIHDNFFELGGHSLLMTQVIVRVREAFQIELSMRRFFESPTIAGLAVAVEELLVEEIEQLTDDQARRLARNAA